VQRKARAGSRPPVAPRSGTGGSSLPLAEARLAAPRVRAGAVARPRILEALRAGEDAALTLVAAPPGYGKTTALSAWSAAVHAAVVWVTLDTGDNDPVRLWTYIATGVDRVRNGLGRRTLQRLSVAGTPIEAAVDELLNALAIFGEQTVIVLDDLHAITDAESLASIEYALTHLPPSTRLIATTRSDPALGLPALRARGALAEVRAADLAFTASEAHELLVDRGHIELGMAEIETLYRRTEGWPAALVLAGIWLRTLDDPRAAVAEFGGHNRFVAEYLSQVALGALDDDVRGFLLRASVLGRFTPELCDDVLGRSDSASVLAELEQSNLFVLRLERGWFRIHSLFAEYARSQLTSRDPGSEAEINWRALRWYRARGLVVEALDLAFAAAEYEVAAELLVEQVRPLFRSGRLHTLHRFVRALPDHLVYEHLELAVDGAVITTMIGGGTLERRRYLRVVDRARTDAPERVSPYVDAMAAMLHALTLEGGVQQAVREGRRAISIAWTEADEVSVSSAAAYAHALYFAGDFDESWAAAMEAVEHLEAERRAPGHALARVILALAAIERGQPEAARIHAEKARSIVGDIGSSRSWLGAQAAAGIGSVNAAEGDLARAEQDFAYAERFFRDEVATVQHTWLLLMLARVRGRRGRLDAAESAMRSARGALGELGDSGRLPALAAEIESELGEAKARANGGELMSSPSDAELAVLRLLVTDLSVREIGAELFLSPNTVRSHTRALYRKLGVRSRADAVARATTLGLLAEAESPV
jgi:LuxR family transcriptional regulator, maltose regulon positive regulatory protein